MKTAREIAADVVKHLDGWELVEDKEPHAHYATIRCTRAEFKDAAIAFCPRGYGADRAKCGISGIWPTLSNGQRYTANKAEVRRICVNGERAGAAVAREIQRRLFPVYLPAFQRAVTYLATRTVQEDAAGAVAVRLANILCAELRSPKNAEHRFHYAAPSGGSATFEVYAGDEVSVSVRLHLVTPAVAERIARILRDAPTMSHG